MGIIKRGILGGFSGKVGNVVGASWKGIDYIRSLPQSVANPRTAGQVAQRNKFSTVINFLQKFTPLIRVGFKNYTNGQSAFNAAMSYNLNNAVTDAMEIDFPKVMISRGSLPGAKEGEVAVYDGKVSMNWDIAQSGNASIGDRTLVLLYNSVKDEAKFMIDEGSRGEGGASAAYPDEWSGDTVVAYVGFITADGKDVSDSLYLGQADIPAV